MDKILIQNLVFYGYTGVFPEEKRLGQRFRVDLEITTDLTTAAVSDQLTDTLDYGVLLQHLDELFQQARFDLLEKLATAIAECVLENPRAHTVKVTLTKCHPPLPFGDFTVGVTIKRHRAE